MRTWVLLLGLLVVIGCVPDSSVILVPVGIEIGEEAPDFALEDITGETVMLSEYRGKQHVVLVFHTGSL